MHWFHFTPPVWFFSSFLRPSDKVQSLRCFPSSDHFGTSVLEHLCGKWKEQFYPQSYAQTCYHLASSRFAISSYIKWNKASPSRRLPCERTLKGHSLCYVLCWPILWKLCIWSADLVTAFPPWSYQLHPQDGVGRVIHHHPTSKTGPFAF